MGIRIENKVRNTDSMTMINMISPLVIVGDERKPNRKLKIHAVNK